VNKDYHFPGTGCPDAVMLPSAATICNPDHDHLSINQFWNRPWVLIANSEQFHL